ncbi:anti-sigma factor [Herbaspirillum rhizosphaerae]|uniref:anti-sigma factor n=1 Tax=Herbaspirillum rhizosphaerae TaxID=346179 RepID=UPI0038B77BAE
MAGEYVLGTLTMARRQEVEHRLLVDLKLRQEVDAWEHRLHPLTALAEPQQPSGGLWPRIERSLFMPAAVRKQGGWHAWWNSLHFWRWTAAASLVASSLLAVLMVSGNPSTRAPEFMVVLVAPQDKSPGWIVQTNSHQQLDLIPLTSNPPPDQKAFQFWTKGDNWKGPVSLGIVKAGQSQRIGLSQLPALQPNQLFEITLEPSAGSSTGKPTGPILYIGRAIQVVSS